jgi:hypothetical protein
VTASEACLDKALGFANDLFNALESVGHRVVIAPANGEVRRSPIDECEEPDKQREYHYRNLWSPVRPTVVNVGTVAIGLAVVEMSERVLLRYVGSGKYIREADYRPPRVARHYTDHTWTTTRDVPSGRLRLVAYCPYWRVSWSTTWQEANKEPLDRALAAIVKLIEDSAPDLVKKLEEAARQAEIARLQWLAEEERRRKVEDRRRVKLSIRESREHLGQTIRRWADVMNVEHFLAGVEVRVSEISGDERDRVLEKLKLAREFLGTQDPLDFFLAWKTPSERYQPRYAVDDAVSDDATDDDEEI